ncbi:FecCD family ABC transporter permease [Parachitinimonas caeni]|uniref:Iron ABC transporter permease n=1 Tax=Parachitinimonas caeni TaxID=3031301 RepID=A0ABT7DYK4_9NEIS|nr:iron ABC transporter permease [Parachitinimonas caeni]MDK2125143.1 iron ABC transporter permease [Parachitinimonas caeni]
MTHPPAWLTGRPADATTAPSGLRRGAWALALISLPMLALASLLLGGGDYSALDSLGGLLGLAPAEHREALHTVLLTLRLPRTLAALLVGSALGVAGMLMQTVTRNHLAEPGLLGINAGAALGVVIGMVWMDASSGVALLGWAGLGALAGNVCVMMAAHNKGRISSPLRLVLAGAALGATFHGLTSAILLSHQAGYDQYRFWLLGSLSGIRLDTVLQCAPLVILALMAALLLTRPLSALRLGDDLARGLGHRPGRLRLLIAVTVTALAGSAVALAGPIAFLGLLAPFLGRKLASNALSQQLLTSAWLGASLLLLADIGARLVIRPFETPASVMTALLGAPLLIWLARQAPSQPKGAA